MTRPERKLLPSKNSNKVSDYVWLEELLASIVGETNELNEQIRAQPLFVIAGGCPNRTCGMQAVMFVEATAGKVEFWWVKPINKENRCLEHNTLPLNTKGPHTNVAKSSAKLYNPFAERFAGMQDESFAFGVEAGRAYILDRRAGETLLLYFIWQEKWSGPLERKKYLEGKICYQKKAKSTPARPAGRFFARQYRVEGDDMKIAQEEDEEELVHVMPAPAFQMMYDMTKA